MATHRNTLLYRLAKIEELSTRDVRDPRTARALYLACPADAL
ncbi:helix-turn-helix domain-containing protein [Streptomyces mirabilis]